MLIKSTANGFAFIAIFYLQLPSVMVQTTKVFPNQEVQNQYQLVMESVNQNADPCEDFYEYACGNSNTKKGYAGQSSMYHILHSNYAYKLADMKRKLLHLDSAESESESSSESSESESSSESTGIPKTNQTFVHKFLAFENSFSYINGTEYFDVLKPSKNLEWPLITELYGGEKQNFDNFDVFAFVGNLFSYGFNNAFMDLRKTRLKNGTLSVHLYIPDVNESPDLDYIDDLLNSLGYSSESDEFMAYKTEIQNSFNNWNTWYGNYHNDSQEVFKYDQLKKTYPKLAIFLENTLPNLLQNDDIIEVNQLEYMEFLMNKQWQPSEKVQFCNYFMTEFYKQITPTVIQNRADNHEIRRYMHLAYNFLFYDLYLKAHEQEISKSFETLANQIYKQILALVEENNLQFTKEQIEAIKTKLGKLHISKGNLPENVNFDMVNEFYSDLPDLNEESYTINMLHLLKHRFAEVVKCPKHMECIAEVGASAGNIVIEDLMVVPFASFTQPMYHWNFDHLFSISLMGTLLGHEFAHAMDTSSLVAKNIYPSHYEEFQKHSQLKEAKECMLQQKSSDDIRERFADFVGARAAYQSYTKEFNVTPTYSTISWQKLFFLNMSQYFCQLPGLTAIKHDANEVRLRQIVMNMNEFSEAYQCPVGSKMNPEKKCRMF